MTLGGFPAAQAFPFVAFPPQPRQKAGLARLPSNGTSQELLQTPVTSWLPLQMSGNLAAYAQVESPQLSLLCSVSRLLGGIRLWMQQRYPQHQRSPVRTPKWTRQVALMHC